MSYAELTALYFVQGAALAMWFVPLTSILDAYGLQVIKPFAFATSGVAAFLSPLFFGAMADRHVAPVIVMRWLAVATAASMALAGFAIEQRANPWLVLGSIQLHQLFSSAAWSMTATVVFLGLRDATREFGPVRALGTLGWMAGCWIISALSFDASPHAGYVGALGWLTGAAMTFLLPVKPPPASSGTLTLRERFGFDALALLKNYDHRVVFITATLAAIPVAAFYPYTPPHLRELGFRRAASWMSLGQTTELVAMISLAAMMARWRIKWVILGGLVLTVARFAFCALGTPAGLLTGVILHGASYTCVSITAQIYLNERVDSAWRARAGLAIVDDERRRQSRRLSRVRLVVRGQQPARPYAMAGILVGTGAGGGSGAGVFHDRLSRPREIAAGTPGGGRTEVRLFNAVDAEGEGGHGGIRLVGGKGRNPGLTALNVSAFDPPDSGTSSPPHGFRLSHVTSALRSPFPSALCVPRIETSGVPFTLRFMPDAEDELIAKAKTYLKKTYGEDTVSMTVTKNTVANGTGALSVDCTVSVGRQHSAWSKVFHFRAGMIVDMDYRMR